MKSGLHDCCIDTSNLLKIGINELPIGALAYFNDSICLGNDYTISFAFTGKGNFDFTYSDNKDTSEVKDAAGDYKLDLKPGSAGIYIYKILSLTDGNNCVAKELDSEDSLSVFKIPDAKAGTDTSVCGLKVQLNATPSIGLGSWSADVPATFFASAAISNPIATVNNNNYGHHYFTWTENNGGCSDKDSIEITFFEQPTSGDAGKDTTYPYLFQVKLQALEPALGKGSWSSPDKSLYFENDSDPSTFVDSLKFGKNYLIWTVVNGVCNAIKDTVVVEVKDLRIPQGFSPNGDGINDKFEIPGIENLRGKNAELIIINKWGAEVYHDTNYKGDWDGTHDGTPLPSDTYYYILRIIGRTYKGFLIIRR